MITESRQPLLTAVREAVHNRAAIQLQLGELSKLAATLSVLLDVNDEGWRSDRV